MTFHRLIRVDEAGEFASQEGGPVNPVLFEKPCIQKENEIVRADEIVDQDEERGGGPKGESMQRGSINQFIEENSKQE